MKLKDSGVTQLANNKACKFDIVCMVRLKNFDNCEFLLCNVRYIPEIKQSLLSISMLNNLDYCTKIEYGVLQNFHGALIMAKESKMCRLYILYSPTVNWHASLFIQDFYDKTKLWHLR